MPSDFARFGSWMAPRGRSESRLEESVVSAAVVHLVVEGEREVIQDGDGGR